MSWREELDYDSLTKRAMNDSTPDYYRTSLHILKDDQVFADLKADSVKLDMLLFPVSSSQNRAAQWVLP
jgi:hypothetical protein